MSDWPQYVRDALVMAGADPEDLELESIATRVECDEPLQALLDAVGRAASELEQQGAKSNRISQQLVEALATFHRETGRP